MINDLQRLSEYYRVPLTPPTDVVDVLFKKGSMNAQRLLTAASIHSPKHVEALSRALWMRIWSRDQDITTMASLEDACTEAKIDSITAKR